MIGYLGLGLLLLAYITLITRWSKLFVPIDILASVVLTIHAIMIPDLPFTIVNGLIAIMLAIKWLQKDSRI